jgi:prepilin-type N-terminal cleavage/methylation domain-containing protein
MEVKKLFTLIELIVVIVVIGILAIIVVPNISSFKQDSTTAAIKSNVKNIQMSTDMYLLKESGSLPGIGTPKPLIPVPVSFELLRPEHLRNTPETKGVKYWIDYQGKIWASTIDSPTGVTFNNSGILSWEHVEGAKEYNIYEVEYFKTLNSSAYQNVDYNFVKKSSTSNANSEGKIEELDLANKIYAISAIDEQGFESPPVGADYQGYDHLDIEPSTTNPTDPNGGELTPYLLSDGSGLRFAGYPSYVSIPHSTNLSSANQTVELWFKKDTPIKTQPQGLIEKSQYTGYAREISLSLRESTCYVELIVADGASKVNTLHYNSNVCDGKWHHVAFTKEYVSTGDIISLYFDGQLAEEKKMQFNAFRGSNEIVLGKVSSNSLSTRYFNGQMDEVRIWSTKRTATEISENMNVKLQGLEPNLEGYWSEEINGTQLIDLTGGNDGVLHGVTPSS